jgi:hypothetical protein
MSLVPGLFLACRTPASDRHPASLGPDRWAPPPALAFLRASSRFRSPFGKHLACFWPALALFLCLHFASTGLLLACPWPASGLCLAFLFRQPSACIGPHPSSTWPVFLLSLSTRRFQSAPVCIRPSSGLPSVFFYGLNSPAFGVHPACIWPVFSLHLRDASCRLQPAFGLYLACVRSAFRLNLTCL